MASAGILSLENEVFSAFVFYAAIVLLKTVLMSILTSTVRVAKQVYVVPEDYKVPFTKQPETITITTDPYIERIRKCHQNDVENIIPFVLLGILYVTTEPSLYAASLHFQIFTCGRLLHTVAYLGQIRQPARFIAFLMGFCVNVCMALRLFLITLL